MMTMMQKGTIAKVAPSSPEKILLQFLFSPRPLMENMKFTRCVEWWSGGDDGRCTLHMYDGALAYPSARVLLNPNHRYRRCFFQIATTCPIRSTYLCIIHANGDSRVFVFLLSSFWEILLFIPHTGRQNHIGSDEHYIVLRSFPSS